MQGAEIAADTRFDNLSLEHLRGRQSSKWTHYPPDVIPAWVAEMDFPVAEPIRNALTASIERSDLGYTPYLEDVPFREVVSNWARHTYSWHVDPASVVVVPNVVRGLQLGLETLTSEGDGVIIQTPIYPPFFSVVSESGRRVVENPLVLRGNRYEIDFDGLEHAMSEATALMLCHPHNPTGRSFTREELRKIADLAIRHDVIVLSDEIHSRLTLPGTSHTVFATLGDEVASRTLTVTAASKAWNFAGLNCGLVIAGSAELTERFLSAGHLAMHGAGLLGMVATVAAFTEGSDWIEAVVAYLDGNRKLLGELFARRLPEIRYVEPDATYLAWLDCRPLDLEPDPYTFFLEEAKVAFSAGPRFGSQGEGFVRLNFATSRQILVEIVERMAAAVRRAKAA